jgi:transposase
MFLSRTTKSAGGADYSYWNLCVTERTARGPRRRVVASLGKLDEAEINSLQGSWDDLGALLRGEPPASAVVKPRPRTALLPGFDASDSPAAPAGSPAAPATPAAPISQPQSQPRESRGWVLADPAAVRVERCRDFGQCYLALALWHRLGLDKLLAQLMPRARESVGWSHAAALLAVARFCAQPSELGVAGQWFGSTALDDLLGIAPSQINDTRLYRALDHLAQHKHALCAHLMERYRDWFGTRFEFLLHDVTSTYFEGACKRNEQAQRGYSRDHRPDCKQVCIGLVCTPEGLPLSFEVFAGNRNDVTTVEQIVLAMEQKHGVAQRIWVMDRGMVSEANLAFLRARQARYLVGTPKSWLRKHEQILLEKDNWHEVREGLEVRLVEHPGAEPGERYVLCRSDARAEKERAMLARQNERLTNELLKIDAWLRRAPQTDLEAVGRRIGKHQGKTPAAAAIIEARLEQDAQGRACALSISSRLAEGQRAHWQKGAYLLRTNCEEPDPVRLWKWYVQLAQAEAAFRTSKSDLGLRPVYHHKNERVQAHILVCFLALAMWRTLEQWMSAKNLGTSARQLIKEIAGLKSMDVIIPVKCGQEETCLRVRVVSTPEPALAQLLGHLGLRLPKVGRILANVVPKTTP